MQEIILAILRPYSNLYQDMDHYHDSEDTDFYNFYVEHGPTDVRGMLQDWTLCSKSPRS